MPVNPADVRRIIAVKACTKRLIRCPPTAEGLSSFSVRLEIQHPPARTPRRKQRSRIRGYIQKGIEEGARLVVGGAEQPEALDKGFFVKPTLFVDVDNWMTIAQEEIFGPVLAVIPYEDGDDAVRIANDSPYGLAGNVMSGSLDHALAVAKRLRAGFLGINGAAGYGADTPFGGYKASGVGRQNGVVGFDQYTEIKSVAYPPLREGAFRAAF